MIYHNIKFCGVEQSAEAEVLHFVFAGVNEVCVAVVGKDVQNEFAAKEFCGVGKIKIFVEGNFLFEVVFCLVYNFVVVVVFQSHNNN
jgi:hypothetical protein